MNVKLILTDEEAGFLYGMLYRVTQERNYRRRRVFSEAEKASQKLSMTLRRKTRKVLPRGAARAIEVINASMI